VIIYVPAAIARDAKFPFRPGDEVNVRIGNRELIIRPRKRVAT
jgi:antitoxin component of MazEF toxin-antitoxin module